MRRLWALAPILPAIVLRALRGPAARRLAGRRWLALLPTGLIVRTLIGAILVRRARRRRRRRRRP